MKINILSKKDFNQEKSVVWIINKHFFKSKIGVISATILPLLFMVIYKIISTGEYSYYFSSALGSYLSLAWLPLTLITLPAVIVDFKNSIILRKISVSTITAWKFVLLLTLYYFVALFVATIIVIVLFSAFLNVDAPNFFSKIYWGEFIYTVFNAFIVSLSFGVLLGVLFKKPTMVQIVGVCILLLSMTLAGQIIPISVVAGNEAIRYVSIFSPLTYPLNLLNNIVYDNSSIVKIIPQYSQLVNQSKSIFTLKDFIILNIQSTSGTEALTIEPPIKIVESVLFYKWQKILNLVMPYIITIGFSFASVKFFSWTSR